jgi:APA family basic amino acid/polyamine antiporter
VLGALTCAGLAVQKLADDPELLLWADGLLAFGLVLWLLERRLR